MPNSTLAIASIVSGILAWTILPLLGALAAIIAGHMARSEIRNAGGNLSGDGLAVFGLVLGYAQMALMVLFFCFFLFVFVVALV
ncbi:DUF4190 domain-containing protein [Candidatus Viridilinea mediisalina]|uniref:DUF4190 domain-containing protein n=1 Tax=Candidatus Viridilinea mediisalina TaxID=2024553 RepID=UPI0034DF2B9D